MSVEDYSEFKLSERIKSVYPPILITIGLVGNTLSIFLLSQHSNRKTSTGIMLIILAITDSLILINSVLVNWLVYLIDFNLRNLSNSACKIHVFLTYLLLQFSVWILVIITIERVYSVLYPHRVRDVFTRKRVLITMAIIFLFLAALNGHLLHGLEIHQTDLQCRVSDEHAFFMFKIWTWLDFAFAFAIPFCILLTGNATIVINLKLSNRFRKQCANVSEDTKQANEKISQRQHNTTSSSFTLTALILNISFVIFVSPFVIFAIGQPYWFSVATLTPKRIAKLILIDAITQMLMYINNTINFVLYILCGPKFRRDLIQLLCCYKGRHRFIQSTVPDSIAFPTYDIIRQCSRLSLSSGAQPCDRF